MRPGLLCGNNDLRNLLTGLTNDRFSSNVTYPFIRLVCPSGLCQKDSSFLKRIKRYPVLGSAIRRYPFRGMNGLRNSSAVGDISNVCCMPTYMSSYEGGQQFQILRLDTQVLAIKRLFANN